MNDHRMDREAREQVEREIRCLFEAGDFKAAATLGLRRYGPEIFGVLIAIHKNDQDASEVFSIFAERLWRGLEGFGWGASFRTWAYVVARNASKNYTAAARVRARVTTRLPSNSDLAPIAVQVRTLTLSYLRTDVKSGVARLREGLAADDQLLLVLRVDKDLSWNDIAEILKDEDAPFEAEPLKRAAARLRQRFQTLKRELLKRAKEQRIV